MDQKELTEIVNNNAPVIAEIEFLDEDQKSIWVVESINKSGEVFMIPYDIETDEAWGGACVVSSEEFKYIRVIRKCTD